MEKKVNVIGVVPARSGSKRLPGKNIKPFCGKPLLAWAVEAGRQSGVLDRVILSTDSEEYAAIGKEYGAEVPFLRPPELAQDTTPTVPVLAHLVRWLKEQEGYRVDYLILLEPTGPARPVSHIKKLVELVTTSGADVAFTVIEVPAVYNAHWQVRLDSENRATIMTGEPCGKFIRRGQDLPKLYCRRGSTYIMKGELLLREEPTLYGEDCRAIVVDPKFNLDIDHEEEWQEAEKRFPTLSHV